MKVTVIADPGLAHQVELCGLMADGIEAHGHQVTRQAPGTVTDADAVVCWGWAIGKRIKGAPVLVLERGHVGDRRHWTAAGWNGLGGRGVRPWCLDDGERWQTHHAARMQPWRQSDGREALIIGQVWHDMAVVDLPMGFPVWAQQTADALRMAGWHVTYRPHPRQAHCDIGPTGSRISSQTLDVDLRRADLCVTYSSTTGVESVLAGVPTIAMGFGAMARDVAGHSLAEIVTPPRESWAHRLAWAQWARDELASGAAWEALKKIRPA